MIMIFKLFNDTISAAGVMQHLARQECGHEFWLERDDYGLFEDTVTTFAGEIEQTR
jgi:hypothetical protein